MAWIHAFRDIHFSITNRTKKGGSVTFLNYDRTSFIKYFGGRMGISNGIQASELFTQSGGGDFFFQRYDMNHFLFRDQIT